MSHISMSHVTYVHESCLSRIRHVPYEWGMFKQACPVITQRINKSCAVRTSHVACSQMMSKRAIKATQRVMSSRPVWVSHVSYKRVMSRMNESCHMQANHWRVEQSRPGGHAPLHAPRLAGLRAAVCFRSRLHMSHDSFVRVTWLVYTCDMTHSYVWHDSFIHVTMRAGGQPCRRSALWHSDLQRTIHRVVFSQLIL